MWPRQSLSLSLAERAKDKRTTEQRVLRLIVDDDDISRVGARKRKNHDHTSAVNTGD